MLLRSQTLRSIATLTKALLSLRNDVLPGHVPAAITCERAAQWLGQKEETILLKAYTFRLSLPDH